MNKLFLLACMVFAVFPGIACGVEPSGSYGNPGDAYLEYSISGVDVSMDSDGAPNWDGEHSGKPITLSGKMIVAREGGTISYVNMDASLGDQEENWPGEGESNLVKKTTVEMPFSLTYTPRKDETVYGSATLRVCGGVCGKYSISLTARPSETTGESIKNKVDDSKEPVYTKNPGIQAENEVREAWMFEEYDESKNYCGPQGKFSGPNRHLISRASFNLACYYHDKCYHECGHTYETQAECDTEFRERMDDACNQELDRIMREIDGTSRWNPLRYVYKADRRMVAATCWTQSSLYYRIVAHGGKLIGAYKCDDSKFA